MRNRLNEALRRHRNAEDGALAPEALIILVALVWVYTAMFVFWDAYKTENLVVKATYTVADMISRETMPIDDAYIDGANTIFGFLSGQNPTNDLRVTVVEMDVGPDGVTPELGIIWSYGTGTWQRVIDIAEIESRVPILAIGDQLIVVEGKSRWTPVFNVGLPERDLYELVVAKRRLPGKVLCGGAACLNT